MDYRSIPRIANSDLSQFEKQLFNRRTFYSAKALQTGQALHRLLLEPKLTASDEPQADMALVRRMVQSGRNNSFLNWVIQFSQNEQVQLWQDEATGLLLKSKLDIVYKNRLVVDIKTTSARSRAAFIKDCERYNYDRQGAFYLDSIARPGGPQRRFTLVAIQKEEPFEVWLLDFAQDSEFIKSGRRKYQFLLSEWERRQRQGIPFVPSSWAIAKPAQTSLYTPEIIAA